MVISGYSGFPTYKTNRHDITEILLKVALNTIKQTHFDVLLKGEKAVFSNIAKQIDSSPFNLLFWKRSKVLLYIHAYLFNYATICACSYLRPIYFYGLLSLSSLYLEV
jgi:hypothetical protein